MKRILYSMFFCVTSIVHCASEAPHEQISRIRQLQRDASCAQYTKYEQAVRSIKAVHHNQQRTRRSAWIDVIIQYSHSVPLLLWQIFALGALALFLWWRHTFLLAFVLGVSLLAVLFIFYERSQEWFVVPQDCALHVGPSDCYPVRGQLKSLDEVRIRCRKPGWACVDRNGFVGWIADA